MELVGTTLEQARQRHAAGDRAEAERLCRRILAEVPDHGEALWLLGRLLLERGNGLAAIPPLTRALVARPREAGLRLDLAAAYRRTGELREAESQYRRLLAGRPDDAVALTNLGDLLRQTGRVAEARRLLARAVTLAPDNAPARCALANLLLHQGDLPGAERLLAEALRLAPDRAYVHRDIGLLRRVQGRPAEAVAALSRALALDPADQASRLGLAICLLRLGRWAEGFGHYAARWSFAGHAPRHRDLPAWTGGDPAGRRLLVWDEQGAGDTLMTARLVAGLVTAGAEVVFELAPALHALFADQDTRFGRVVARGWTADTPGWQQVPLMDLPGLLGIAPTGIPWPGPYLAADPARLERWFARIGPAAPGLRVGVCWAGNPAHPGDRWRSPRLALLDPLFDLPGIRWFGLQVAEGRADLDGRTPPPGFTDLGADIADWADTAAILCHLDLLICPDTGLAHLAGALGRPCWMLVSTDTDWRWQETGETTPWYPSLRLFRQTAPGDWAGVVARVAAALSRRTATA